MPTTKSEEGEEIRKPSSQWSGIEKKKMSLNSKAMNVLFCAIDKKEFHRVSCCESAYEFERNLKLYMNEQIKSRSVKLVDSLGNMRYFKWNHMSVFMICTLDSPIL